MIVLCTVGFYTSILTKLSSWMLCEEGDRVVNCLNHVDCEAMCGLMNGDMKCMNVLCMNPFSSMC